MTVSQSPRGAGTSNELPSGRNNLLGDYAMRINELLRPAEPRYTALDLFAGCGGLGLGFEAAGFKTTGFEANPDSATSYRKNLNATCFEQFITDETKFPSADIVIGGPPCQPFSLRGVNKGKDDDRNGFPAFVAAIEQVRPKIWLFENVKGLLTKHSEYLKHIFCRLEELGYKIEFKVFNTADFGVPQKRERLVVVGHLGNYSFPEFVDSPHVTAGVALRKLPRQVSRSFKYLTPAQDEYIARYERASHCSTPRDLHLDRPARTLTCRNLAAATSDMHRLVTKDGRRRRLTIREAARLQSFPDWYKFCGTDESALTQIGNAVPPLFAYQLAKSIVAYLDNGGRHG